MSAIPDRVRAHVARALAALRDIHDSIEQGRTTDRLFDGGGRYESEVIGAIAGKAKAAHAALDRFRAVAAEQGADADALVAEMGGLPDLSPSAAAVRWMAPVKSHAPGSTYRYAPLLRPPGPGAVPREGLVPGSARPAIDPKHRHGTVDYTRPLTAQEAGHFDMVLVQVVAP